MYHVFGEILMQVDLKYRCLHWKAVWKHLIIGKASVFLNNPKLVEFCLLLKQSEFHHEIRWEITEPVSSWESWKWHFVNLLTKIKVVLIFLPTLFI